MKKKWLLVEPITVELACEARPIPCICGKKLMNIPLSDRGYRNFDIGSGQFLFRNRFILLL